MFFTGLTVKYDMSMLVAGVAAASILIGFELMNDSSGSELIEISID